MLSPGDLSSIEKEKIVQDMQTRYVPPNRSVTFQDQAGSDRIRSNSAVDSSKSRITKSASNLPTFQFSEQQLDDYAKGLRPNVEHDLEASDLVCFPDQKEQHRYIAGNFPTCQVPKFKRGCGTSIQSWFFQMETYFQFAGVPSDLWVREIIKQVHQCHFEELSVHALLPYPIFKQKMSKFFKAPDLTQSLMKECCEVQQEPDESLYDFMTRVQDLVEKAFRKFPDDTK